MGESALYSERDPEAEKVNLLLKQQNAEPQEDVAYLKDLLKLQKQLPPPGQITLFCLKYLRLWKNDAIMGISLCV